MYSFLNLKFLKIDSSGIKVTLVTLLLALSSGLFSMSKTPLLNSAKTDLPSLLDSTLK